MFILFHRVVSCFLLSILLCLISLPAFSQESDKSNQIATTEYIDETLGDIEDAFSSKPMQIFKEIKELTRDIDYSSLSNNGTSAALTTAKANRIVSLLQELLENSTVKGIVGESELKPETIVSYLKTLVNNLESFEKAYAFYKRAIEYLDRQYQDYVHSSFIKHLERGLFEYSESDGDMVAKYLVRGNRLVVVVQLDKDIKHKYLFYQYSNEEFLLDSADQILLTPETALNIPLNSSDDHASISQINSIVAQLEEKRNAELDTDDVSPVKKFNTALAALECQERINGFETTTIRLGESLNVLGVYSDKAPKFFKEPIRFLSEYLKSIYEPPQFLLGIVGAVIQCSVIALIYVIKGQTLVNQVPQLLLTATFATLMGSFIGSYRNYVDKGPIYRRIIKECAIGALFLYSFKILESGLSSVSFFSLMGIWTNIKIIGIMYLSKLFKYPYTFIPRMFKDLGYYGTEGQATVQDPILHVKWNARNLHNQIIYNLVSFGLKIAALIGIYVTVDIPVLGKTDLNIATALFLSSPIIALIINHRWIEYEYKSISIKYRLDPTPTHKKGLERREKIYNRVRGYIDTMKSLYYGTLGVISGNYLLKRKETQLLKEPESIEDLSFKSISKMSIRELKALLAKVEDELAKLEDSNNDDLELKKSLVTQSVTIKIYLEELIREAAIVRAVRTKISQKSKQVRNTVKTVSLGCMTFFSGLMQ